MAAGSLLGDIEMEILLKLPVESLVRFKLVSKSWYSLITNRQFIKLHLRQSVESDNDSLFVTEGSIYEYVIKSSSYFLESTGSGSRYQHHPYLNKNRYWILCTCDGLVMMRKIPYWRNIFLVIWNPATGESRELPRRKSDCCSTIPYGLGYDCSADDYKVVYGAYHEARDKITMMVFSLKSNSWRKTKVFKYTISTSSTRGTHANGVIYWLISSTKKLIGFTLAEEKMMELPLPDDAPADEDRFDQIVLGELKGRLCLSQCICESNSRGIYTLNVWLMEEHGDEAAAAASWAKFITLPQMSIDITHWLGLSVFCFSKHAVFVMKDGYDDSAALVFDLKKQKLVKARRFDGPSSRRIFTLYQSLVSPN